MKRLKLSDFFTYYGHGPVTPETPWSKALVDETSFGFDNHDKRRADLNDLLGVHRTYDFYGSNSALNPLAALPVAVVIEKVNRAAEQLGILED